MPNSRLSIELAWFIEQANNPANSPEDRRLWQMLADELVSHILVGDDREQLDLFTAEDPPDEDRP